MNELRREMEMIHAQQEQASLVPRLQQELALARGNHAKTVALLRALKAGLVRIEQVVIDGDNWQVLDPAETSIVIEDASQGN